MTKVGHPFSLKNITFLFQDEDPECPNLNNVKYSPIDDFPGARRSVEFSVEACKARCEADPACEHFSFWAKELPEDNGCTLFGGNAVFGHEKETNYVITGPATCPGEIESLFIEFHFHPFFRPFLRGSFSHAWFPQSLFTHNVYMNSMYSIHVCNKFIFQQRRQSNKKNASRPM